MPAEMSIAPTGLFELRIFSPVGPLLGPRGLVPPKWTGRLHAMALATANQACMCPRLGCLATLHRIRAHPLVATPRVLVCPLWWRLELLARPLVTASRLCAQPCFVPKGPTPWA